MANKAVSCGPRGIMIMKSTMWVNWMPAKVMSSQRSWAGGKVVCIEEPMKSQRL